MIEQEVSLEELLYIIGDLNVRIYRLNNSLILVKEQLKTLENLQKQLEAIRKERDEAVLRANQLEEEKIQLTAYIRELENAQNTAKKRA